MAIEMARRTRTSLNGGLSCASASPNGASVLWNDCVTAAVLVLPHRLDLAGARQPDDVALPRAERRHAGRGVRRGEDDVLVDVGAALVEVVRIPRQHHPDLARVLLQDVGPGADHALLEVAVLFQHLAREHDGDGLGQVVREQHVRRLQMHAHRVLVRRLDALHLLEREGLDTFLRIGLEAVLDVRRHQLAPVERRHIVPLDPWRSLNVHTRWSGLACHDSARSPFSVRSVGPVTSSGNT